MNRLYFYQVDEETNSNKFFESMQQLIQTHKNRDSKRDIATTVEKKVKLISSLTIYSDHIQISNKTFLVIRVIFLTKGKTFRNFLNKFLIF